MTDVMGLDATNVVLKAWNSTPDDGRVHHFGNTGNSRGSSTFGDYFDKIELGSEDFENEIMLGIQSMWNTKLAKDNPINHLV